jgi:heterodisulfide reductase subunit C
MAYLPQLLFLILLATAAYFISQRIGLIKKAIQLGKSENRTDRPNERLKNMILIALGQKKMFNRPIVGILHLVVYLGFVIINIEVLEIILDGLLGTHRLFLPFLGSFYLFLINSFELLALGVLLACVVFLTRRYVSKTSRLQTSAHAELKGWPVSDATIILITEIVLMWAFLSMNAADSILQERSVGHYTHSLTGDFAVSKFIKPIFANWSDFSLLIYERAAWWFHILGIMAFALYLTYSKHLHIVLAFPNTYFASLKPKGQMENMPVVTQEVKSMLGLPLESSETPSEIGRFGAKDVYDLSWKNLMDAYSCTECGRCTSSCPANLTGKALSPRKIMMDTRDRLEDIQKGWKTQGPEFKDEKSLLGDYISEEEVLACTSCNACVEECPILISPLDIILQLRRYNVMEESKAPQSWNMMFQNLETNMAPWKFSPSDRFNWKENLND